MLLVDIICNNPEAKVVNTENDVANIFARDNASLSTKEIDKNNSVIDNIDYYIEYNTEGNQLLQEYVENSETENCDIATDTIIGLNKIQDI